jgi:hypothetical protein
MAHNSLIRNPVTKWNTYFTASWIANHAYTTAQLVFPTVSNGFVYECTTGGTSSPTTEPTWPLTIGATVTDGSVVWTCYSTIAVLVAELQTLDANLTAAINAVDGSTHQPSSAIVIGGDGLSVTGLTTIARGGTLTGTVTNDIAFNNDDFPTYVTPHVGQTRTFMQPCVQGRGVDNFTWRCRFSDCGMQSISPQYDLSDGLGLRVSRFWVPIRANDQSTLTSVTVNFRVGFAHTTLPATMPSVRVIQVNASGQAVPLTSSVAGGDVNGRVSVPTPGDASVWSPASGAQQLVITCDQNNVIDLTQFAYYVEIVEEQWPPGTGYPWQLVYKQPVKVLGFLNFSGSPPNGLQTLDGYTTSDGDRVCLSGVVPNTYDGFWIVHVGAWQRALDWVAATDFSQGLVVLVDRGATNGGSAWQAPSTIPSWQPGTQPPNTYTWSVAGTYSVGQTAIPRNNVTGYWYQVTAISGSGIAGATEPVWPSGVGQTIVDNPGVNEVVWTCMGFATTSVTFAPAPPTDDETQSTQGTGFFAHGNIWQSVTCVFSGIEDAHWQ